MPQNVQLTAKEAVKVYVEIGSNRILGFSPEHARPLFSGFRYREQILLHAREIEQWVARYQRQQQDDAEKATFRQIKRESAFRAELRNKIRERSKHVNEFNRQLNETLIKLMDLRYDKMMEAKMKPQAHSLAELSETSNSRDNDVLDFATKSPLYRDKPDPRVSGSAVRGELEKIVREKIN